MPRVVHVIAPSRLHFGLWSLGGGEGRQFGGVGAMIEQPELELSFTAAEEFSVIGDSAERVVGSARRWAEFHCLPAPRCRIDISKIIPQHAGLGSGTQLGRAVAA